MYGGYVISILLVFTWLCMISGGVHAAVSERETGMEKVTPLHANCLVM